MQHSVKLPRDVLKLHCNGLFFCTCLVFCRDALCGGSNISSSVAGLAVSACGNGLSERLADTGTDLGSLCRYEDNLEC